MRARLLLLAIAFAAACTNEGSDDDDDSEDAGISVAVDAGPTNACGDAAFAPAEVQGINSPCDVDEPNGRGGCVCGAVCVAINNSSVTGVCRVRCGDFRFNLDSEIVGATRDDAVTCPGVTTCQLVTTLPFLDPVAVACVNPALARDAICVSALDGLAAADFEGAACPAEQKCVLTDVEHTALAGDLATSLNCKEPCDPAAPACTRRDDACMPAPRGDGFHCAFPVRGFFVADEADFGDPALFCNEVDNSRYCDPSIVASTCLGVSATSNDGVCFAQCGNPDIDLDGDGSVDIAAARSSCGAGFDCTPELALFLGHVVDLDSACAVDACPADALCPACGPDAFCSAGRCVAPFFSCEPS